VTATDRLELQVRTTPAVAERITAYYDETQILYSSLWSGRGVHCGFWDDGTRRLQDAIRNHDAFVAGCLGLSPRSRVLDAGCGVGGTSLHLAREYGHDVLGITLSTEQLQRARRYARRCREPRPSYEIADYLDTGLPSASFDGVVAIESCCYAEPKAGFLREAHRLLRPGGRLVVSDGFLGRPLRDEEKADYCRLIEGFALTSLEPLAAFVESARLVGFESIELHDKQAEIMPSSRIMERRAWVGLVLSALPCTVGLLPRSWLRHALCGVSQRRLLVSGAIRYFVLAAQKPNRG
jgi:cyclopropane fatty-acyl-phospholipid synthase-like methyltransferase